MNSYKMENFKKYIVFNFKAIYDCFRHRCTKK